MRIGVRDSKALIERWHGKGAWATRSRRVLR